MFFYWTKISNFEFDIVDARNLNVKFVKSFFCILYAFISCRMYADQTKYAYNARLDYLNF